MLYGGLTQMRWRLATTWEIRDSNHSAAEIFQTHLHSPRGPPVFLQNGYWVTLPLIKQWAWH